MMPATKRASKVMVSIGVVCVPRNDKMAARVMLDLAEAAALHITKKQGRELMTQMREWIAKNKLGPKGDA